jgi:hypothetical protein
MSGNELRKQASKSLSRRSVIRTGVKLGYAAPIVAASFRLSEDGGLAAGCSAPFQEVTLPTGRFCCTCQSTVIRYTLVVQNGQAMCQAAGATTIRAFCVGGALSP